MTSKGKEANTSPNWPMTPSFVGDYQQLLFSLSLHLSLWFCYFDACPTSCLSGVVSGLSGGGLLNPRLLLPLSPPPPATAHASVPLSPKTCHEEDLFSPISTYSPSYCPKYGTIRGALARGDGSPRYDPTCPPITYFPPLQESHSSSLRSLHSFRAHHPSPYHHPASHCPHRDCP